MRKLPLNFPVFYQCAVKGNTNLPQYNAVSILLLGRLRGDFDDVVIGDAEATGYTSGKKRIKKEILTQVIQISEEEARARINNLGFQNPTRIAEAIRELLTIIDAPPDIQQKISEDLDSLSIIAYAFMGAIKCPPKDIFPLEMEDKTRIALCYAKENTAVFMEGLKENKVRVEEPKSSPPPQKSGVMTQEEIEALLNAAPGFPKEEKKSNPVKQPEEKPAIWCKYIFRDQGMDLHFFFELVNEALSCGITGLSDLFNKVAIYPNTPTIAIYDDFYNILDELQHDDGVRVFYQFTIGSIDDYRIPDEREIYGIIMVDIDPNLVQDFFEKQVELQAVKFTCSSQKLEYQISMYNEIGNIFSGLAATAIANLTKYPVTIRLLDSASLDLLLSHNKAIVAGQQPFKLNDGKIIHTGLFVLPSMVKKLWELYEE